MMWKELQLEGLVGPSHNYSGLGSGNIASTNNAQSISNPRAAALQSLEKMNFLHNLGVPVAVSPPQFRPDFSVYTRLGLVEMSEIASAMQSSGNIGDTNLLDRVFELSPALLQASWSASSMWSANSATVTITDNTGYSIVNITPANLISTLHRMLECKATTSFLRQVFPDPEYFLVHDALSATTRLNDEGAANHMWLNDENNTQIFIYGSHHDNMPYPVRFAPRQQYQASKNVAEHHALNPQHVYFLQQTPKAIDAGVFHNDVIAMSHWGFLAYHEDAFVDDSDLIQLEVASKIRKIMSSELSLEDAVTTYFFNAQIVTDESGDVHILFPSEVAEHKGANALSEALISEENPLKASHFLDLKQSMRNGGGPACLRLRVPVTDDHLKAMHQGVRFTPRLYERLKGLVEKNYRDRVSPEDLRDIDFAKECWDTQKAILSLLNLS